MKTWKWILSLIVMLLACVAMTVCFLGILAVPDGQTGETILSVPLPTPTLVPTPAPTWTPVAVRPTDTPLTIGETYYTPWGSSLCEFQGGGASLDWLDPHYCRDDKWLDQKAGTPVVLLGSEGDWCAVVGEYVSLDGTMEPVGGWVACRLLTITPQEKGSK